jgi:hypothetical protein
VEATDRNKGDRVTMPRQYQSPWIFVSHSDKDIGKVREIRNELEKRGHKPIIFYLKCVEDNSAPLPDLLGREIAVWDGLCPVTARTLKRPGIE